MLRVFGKPLKNNNSTIAPVEAEETPEVIGQLLQAADGYVQGIFGEEAPTLNQVIAYGVNRKSDVIKSLVRKDVTPGSHCIIVALGASNRVLRFRSHASSTIGEDGKKKTKRGAILADIKVFFFFLFFSLRI